MAGSLTVTTSDVGHGVHKYVMAWTSDSSGDVNSNAFDVAEGYLLHLKIVPDTGSTQPTDAYDLSFEDEDSVNLLSDGSTNQGANLSQSTGKAIVFDPPYYHDATQQLDPVITNAGNAKTGTLTLYVRAEPDAN